MNWGLVLLPPTCWLRLNCFAKWFHSDFLLDVRKACIVGYRRVRALCTHERVSALEQGISPTSFRVTALLVLTVKAVPAHEKLNGSLRHESDGQTSTRSPRLHQERDLLEATDVHCCSSHPLVPWFRKYFIIRTVLISPMVRHAFWMYSAPVISVMIGLLGHSRGAIVTSSGCAQ